MKLPRAFDSKPDDAAALCLIPFIERLIERRDSALKHMRRNRDLVVSMIRRNKDVTATNFSPRGCFAEITGRHLSESPRLYAEQSEVGPLTLVKGNSQFMLGCPFLPIAPFKRQAA